MVKVTMKNFNKEKLLGLLQKLRRYKGKVIKDSQLLREYAFVKDQDLESGEGDCAEAYWKRCGKYVGEEGTCRQVCRALRIWHMEDFLRFIVPEQIGSAAECIRALRLTGLFPSDSNHKDESAEFRGAHKRAVKAIIEVRLAAYRKSHSQNLRELASEPCDQTSKEQSISNDANHKLDLYHAVNAVKLSQAGVWTDLMRKNSKALRRLGDTREEIIKRCRICLQKERLEVDKRLRYLHPKIREMGARNVLDALLIDSTSNDLALINSLLYKTVTTSLGYLRSNEHLAFINVPHSFIFKWINDYIMRGVHASFVPSSRDICDILNLIPIIKENSKLTVALAPAVMQRVEIDYKLITCLVIAIPEQPAVSETVYREIQKWIPYIANNCRIFVLAGNSVTRNMEENVLNPKHTSLEVEAMYLLPLGIARSTSPRRKVLLCIRYHKQGLLSHCSTVIRRYNLVEYKNEQYLMADAKPELYVSKEELDGSTVRGAYHRLRRTNDAKGGKRQRPDVYDFSDELKILYRFSRTKGREDGSNKELGYVEAYFCRPYVSNSGALDHEKIGKKISSTSKRKRGLSLHESIKWVANEYPFEQEAARTSTMDIELAQIRSIREIVSAECRSLFAKKDISIRTLWFLYPEFDKKFEKEDLELLRRVVMSDIGNLKVKDNNTSIINSYVNCVFASESAGIREVVLALVSELYELAVENQHAQMNILTMKESNIVRQARNRPQEVRDSLGIRSLELELFRKLFAGILSNLNAPLYIAVLLRCMYGLSPGELAALTWGDYKGLKCSEFSYIHVRSKLENQTLVFFPTGSNENKLLPLLPFIADTIESNKEQQMIANNLQSEEELSDCSLFVTESMSLRTAISVRGEIQQLSRNCIKSLQIADDVVLLHDERRGIIRVNLSSYRGDLFRSNISHYMRNYGGFEEGEVAYVFGNQPSVTVNRFYIDYSNEMSLLRIGVKMNHILALLKDNQSVKSFQRILIGRRKKQLSLSSPTTYPASIELDFEVEPGNAAMLTLISSYGFTAIATQQFIEGEVQ